MERYEGRNRVALVAYIGVPPLDGTNNAVEDDVTDALERRSGNRT